MNEPKLEDFDISEKKLNFAKKFKNSIERRKKWLIFLFAIFFYPIYLFLSWFIVVSIGDNLWSVVIAMILFYCLWIPLTLSEFLSNKVDSHFLLTSEKNKLYEQIEEHNKKYEEQLKIYNEYLQKIEQEKFKKYVNEKLDHLSKLKEEIFNQKLTEDNYKYFLDFKNTLQDLEKDSLRIWAFTLDSEIIGGEMKDEQNKYEEFKKYFESRKRQLDNQKYDKKTFQTLSEELKENSFDTDKIKIDNFEERDGKNIDTTDTEERQRTFTGNKVDFEEINKHNISLGLLGEKAIIDYEKEILNRNGKTDLAEKVKHVSEEEGAGTGYDILSFNFDETPKYIEVKTTKSGKKTPFILSENEIAFIENNPQNCSIYRLYDFDEEAKTGNLIMVNGYEEIMNSFNLKASQYKARIK